MTAGTANKIDREMTRAVNNFWNALAQDFRCGTAQHRMAKKVRHDSHGCYCATIRCADLDQKPAMEGKTVARSTIRGRMQAREATERRLEAHLQERPKAYAYVTHGEPEEGNLFLLQLEIVGPSSLHPFVKRVPGMETQWVAV